MELSKVSKKMSSSQLSIRVESCSGVGSISLAKVSSLIKRSLSIILRGVSPSTEIESSISLIWRNKSKHIPTSNLPCARSVSRLASWSAWSRWMSTTAQAMTSFTLGWIKTEGLIDCFLTNFFVRKDKEI